jgi:CheY-like chemotaxis protein
MLTAAKGDFSMKLEPFDVALLPDSLRKLLGLVGGTIGGSLRWDNRAGRPVLEATGAIEVVAEAGDGEEAIRAAEAHRPDVVLMDIRMPRVDGIEATRRLPRQRWLRRSLRRRLTARSPGVPSASSAFERRTRSPLTSACSLAAQAV